MNHLSNACLYTIILIFSAFNAFGQPGAPRLHLWDVNANVNAFAEDTANHILYIGGEFTYVGPVGRYNVLLDSATGDRVHPALPLTSGPVYASIPDGNGGLFIGGNFTKVGDSTRNMVAHIDHLGHVSAWKAHVTGTVYTMALNDSILFIGGIISAVNSTSRKNVAALNTTSGALRSWAPSVNGAVNSIVLNGSLVYLGGAFTQVGTSSRNGVAAVLLTNGSLSPWSANVNKTVRFMKMYNNMLYIGGNFTTVNGQNRSCLAALDPATGTPSAWTPSVDSAFYYSDIFVRAFEFLDSIMYVGGYFRSLNGQLRKNLGAININTGVTTPWDPDVNDGVETLKISGHLLYAGGAFTTVKGVPQGRFAAIDVSSGNPTGWNPDAFDNSVLTLCIPSNGTIYLGGGFGSIGGVLRNRLAAIDLVTGKATNWNPNVNGTINAMTLVGDRLYIGGAFTQAGGLTRNRAAVINTQTGQVGAWNPDANNEIHALIVKDSVVYLGGCFSTIKGVTRRAAAATDTSVGTPKSWNPNLSPNCVYSLEATRNTVYAGGTFLSPRNFLACLNTTTGQPKSWTAIPDDAVGTVKLWGDKLLVTGYFRNISGSGRNYVALLDTASGTPRAWNPGFSGFVWTGYPVGSQLFASGGFTAVNGQPASFIALFDSTSSLPITWNHQLKDRQSSRFFEGQNILCFGQGYETGNWGSDRWGFTVLERGTVLPVTLLLFEGTCAGKQNKLVWQTGSEINNDHFVVERSEDGQLFLPAGKVTGSGNSKTGNRYVWIDPVPFSTTYYRLKQMDYNGQSAFSQVIVLQQQQMNTQENVVFPNPAKNELAIIYHACSQAPLQACVMSISGIPLATFTLPVKEGNNTISIDISTLSKGIYLLQTEQHGQLTHYKFTKE